MISSYINPQFPPRPYQAKAVEALMTCDKGIIHSPTGSGKTNIMAYLIANLQKTALVIVPAIDLITQTKERFEKILDKSVTIGTLGGGVVNKQKQLNSDILITTWQSLGSKKSDILEQLKGKHEVVIVDECHHASADVLFNTINYLAPYAKKIYGVSATPYRSSYQDEARLMKLFGDNLAYRVDINKLYNDGFLVRPNIDIIKVGSYNLGAITEENLIKKSFRKKVAIENSYNDFVDDILKIGYVVVNNITKEPAFKIYELTKTAINGSIKPLDNYDIGAMKNFLKDCFNNISDDKTKKILLSQNIIKAMRYKPQNTNFQSNSTISIEKQEELIYNLGRIFSIFAKSIIAKNPKISPYNWENIGQKIGYLKKAIDEDFIRQQQIEFFLKQNLEKKDIIRAVILTNSISWGKRLHGEFAKNFDNIVFYYLDGNTKNKNDIFEAVRNEKQNFVLISNTALIKEGIDLPSVNCIYQLSPVFNPINAIYSMEQIIGRAIRPSKNKNSAEIYIFDAFTTDFSNRRDEIFKTINENVQPKKFTFFNGIKKYIINNGQNLKNVLIENNEDMGLKNNGNIKI